MSLHPLSCEEGSHPKQSKDKENPTPCLCSESAKHLLGWGDVYLVVPGQAGAGGVGRMKQLRDSAQPSPRHLPPLHHSSQLGKIKIK